MQPGLKGSKGPVNSIKNTAIFDTISWYWTNHFETVDPEYATGLLKVRLSDDVLKLAEDTSRNGDFFNRKKQNDEHWAWWVFPSFSRVRERFDFSEPKNIESGRCISGLILCSPEYIKAYTKIIKYVANEIDNCKNNRAELENRFEKNVDFFKMLFCIRNLCDLPLMFETILKCESPDLLKEFYKAVQKFSDSIKKSIKECRINDIFKKKNDKNINFFKKDFNMAYRIQSIDENLPLKNHISENKPNINTPIPEINKKFFGKTEIRNDYHYLIIKYYNEYLKNGGEENIDEFLLSKHRKASSFYNQPDNALGEKIRAYKEVDAPSLLCFFNDNDSRHRLDMIKECIEIEKHCDPHRNDILSILIYEYSKAVKPSKAVKSDEYPYAHLTYAIQSAKDFFTGLHDAALSGYHDEKAIDIILSNFDATNQIEELADDTFTNNANLPRSVISEEDIPFRKYLIKYKQVDKEKNIPNHPIQRPERRRRKEITQNSQNQPQIKISFPVRKRYHDLMLKYYEMYRYPNDDNIYEWINEANRDAMSVYNEWNDANRTAMSMHNNLPLKNFIKPHQLVCMLNNMPDAKERLYTIQNLLFFPECMVDPELMAIIVNEYYSITRNKNKLDELKTLLTYYLGKNQIDIFIKNSQERIKDEIREIRKILNTTDIKKLNINNDEVDSFEANERSPFDEAQLQELYRPKKPPQLPNLSEGSGNIRKDLLYAIWKEFKTYLNQQDEGILDRDWNIGMFVESAAQQMSDIFTANPEKTLEGWIDENNFINHLRDVTPARLLCWFNNTEDEQSRLDLIKEFCTTLEKYKSKIKILNTKEIEKQNYANCLAAVIHEYYIINKMQPSGDLKRCFDNYFGYNKGHCDDIYITPEYLISVYEEEITRINAEINEDKIEENTEPTTNDDDNTPEQINNDVYIPKVPKYTEPIIPLRKMERYTYPSEKKIQENKKEINRIARNILQFFIDHKDPNERLNLLRQIIKSDKIDKNIYTPLIVFCYCHTLNDPRLDNIYNITKAIVKRSNLYGFGEQSVNNDSEPFRKVIQRMEIIKRNFDIFSNNNILEGMTCTVYDLLPSRHILMDYRPPNKDISMYDRPPNKNFFIPRIKQPGKKINKNILRKKRIFINNNQEELFDAIQNGLQKIQQTPNNPVENQTTFQNLKKYADAIRQAISV